MKNRYVGLIAVMVFTMIVYKMIPDKRLINALESGNRNLAIQLIDSNINLNTQNILGETALHIALKFSMKEIFHLLLEKGARTDICDRWGTSIVHAAATHENSYFLKEVLTHGANPNQVNSGNRANPNSTPLFYALNRGLQGGPFCANAALLIQHGADINWLDKKGSTPLDQGLAFSCLDLMIAMLEQGDAKPTEWFIRVVISRLKNHEYSINEMQKYAVIYYILVDKGLITNYLPADASIPMNDIPE